MYFADLPADLAGPGSCCRPMYFAGLPARAIRPGLILPADMLCRQTHSAPATAYYLRPVVRALSEWLAIPAKKNIKSY